MGSLQFCSGFDCFKLLPMDKIAFFVIILFLNNAVLFAQESTDLKPVSTSNEATEVSAILSDWVLSGSNTYNLSNAVGIGTSSPGYKLDVLHGGSNGLRIKSSNQYSVVDIDAFNGDAALRFFNNGSKKWILRSFTNDNFQILHSSSGGERIGINAVTGYVGINDPSPVARLSVNGDIKIKDGTQAVGRVLTSDANGVASWQANPSSPFLVSGGNIYYSAGNVGINTSTPNGRLQFSNVISNRGIVLYENANNEHQYYGFGVNSNTLRYQVGTSGNHVFYASINSTTSKELFKIASNGNINAAGVISFTSDRRLKKNIEPLLKVMPKLNALQGYHFNWIDKTYSNRLQTGLIAQEVEDIFPELVDTNESGYKLVNYIGLVPVLLEGIKDLQHQLDEKTMAIQDLKEAFEDLKSQFLLLSASNQK